SPSAGPEEYLYRSKLDGSAPAERVTPASEPGVHAYELSPDRSWAIHTASRFSDPPKTTLVSLPDDRAVRTLVDNAELKTRAAELLAAPAEFFQLPIGGGVTLDGWLIKPARFEATRKYPLLVYVYGEPAGQTVRDGWGGDRGLFHRAL